MPPTNSPPLLVQIARLLTFYTLAISLRVAPVAAPNLIERYSPVLTPLVNACRRLTDTFPAPFTALWTILELTMFSFLFRDTGRLLERLGLFPLVQEQRRSLSGVDGGAEVLIAPEDGVTDPPVATSPSRLLPEEKEEATQSPPSPSSTNELFSLTAGVYFAMGRIFSNNVVSPQRSIWQNIPAVLLSLLRDLGFVAVVLWVQSRLRRSARGRENAAVGEGGTRADGHWRLGGTAERKY